MHCRSCSTVPYEGVSTSTITNEVTKVKHRILKATADGNYGTLCRIFLASLKNRWMKTLQSKCTDQCKSKCISNIATTGQSERIVVRQWTHPETWIRQHLYRQKSIDMKVYWKKDRKFKQLTVTNNDVGLAEHVDEIIGLLVNDGNGRHFLWDEHLQHINDTRIVGHLQDHGTMTGHKFLTKLTFFSESLLSVLRRQNEYQLRLGDIQSSLRQTVHTHCA